MTDYKIRRNRILFALILVFTFACSVSLCYADTGGAADEAALLQRFSSAYNILVGIGLAGAIISLAVAAVQTVVGNATVAAKARTAAIYIIVAVAAMYLIPKMLAMGVSWGQSHAWNPASAA